MSVRPVTFNPDGSVEVVLDELGHSGTLPPDQIIWAGDDHTFIVLTCPDGCGSTSTHPVGGGAAPVEVQQMFVQKTQRDGCACGSIAAGDTTATPEAHVRLNVNRMDGAGRWQLDTQPAPRAGGPPMFQVVYRTSDRLIVGLEPSGGVGPNNRVAVIHDLTEYDVLMQTDPAYLSADGGHVVGSPP